MKNRIRLFRQRSGMTLRQLADAVGTTPQSVSRLETGNMTLSTEWLERFASVLKVHPVDLLEGPGSRDIELVGVVNGGVVARSAREAALTLDVPAEDPIAVRLETDCGQYHAGEILVGDRLTADDFFRADGRDCIVMTAAQEILLRRVAAVKSIRGSALGGGIDGFLLTPLDQGRDSALDSKLRWIAPLILRLTYI